MLNINNLRVKKYDEEGISLGTVSLRAYITSMGFSGHSLVQDFRYFLEDGGYWVGNINESLKGWYEGTSSVELRSYWYLNGASYVDLPLSLVVEGDFEHEFTGTFSANGFHLLSNTEATTNRVMVFANTKILYARQSNKLIQFSDSEYSSLTDGLVHTVRYGRASGIWYFYADDVSVGSYLGSDSGSLTFEHFGLKNDVYTSIPTFEGYHYNHTITGAGITNYPTGELVMAMDEDYSDAHTFTESSNGLTGTKVNDVAEDYTTTEPS